MGRRGSPAGSRFPSAVFSHTVPLVAERGPFTDLQSRGFCVPPRGAVGRSKERWGYRVTLGRAAGPARQGIPATALPVLRGSPLPHLVSGRGGGMDQLCSVSPQDRLWGTAGRDLSSPTLEGEPRANRGRIRFTGAVPSICFKPWAPDMARLVLWPVLRSGLFWLGNKGTPGGNMGGACSLDPSLGSWVSVSPLRFLWSYS